MENEYSKNGFLIKFEADTTRRLLVIHVSKTVANKIFKTTQALDFLILQQSKDLDRSLDFHVEYLMTKINQTIHGRSVGVMH